MAITAKRDDILKLRIDSATLGLLERARTYIDLNKSKFVRESIREKAETIIAQHEQTRFNSDDWHMFFNMLDTPAEPTARMKKAAQKYKKITAGNEI